MNQYQEHTANFKRLETDALLIDFDQRAEFEGCIEKAFQFVHDEQLMNRTLWKRFVQQFRDGLDSEKGAWRGEYWGKMMRGACFVYAYTRDDALYRLLTETMEDILTTQDEAGRISSFTAEKELFGWDLWCRKYVLLGMQYFLEISEDAALNRRLIDSMCRQVDDLIGKIGPEEGKIGIFETSQTWRGLNSSTILEPVVRLYNLTGEQRYLDFAAYVVDCGGTAFGNLVDMALEDKLAPYQYPVTKAYEMMSFFEGVLEYYRVTKEEKYKTAVLNYGKHLMDTDITIIGSAGCTHELLDHSKVRQSDPNSLEHKVMQETCVTVTWMKFCCQLLLLSGDVSFADCIEQSLYNAYLGSLNTKKAIDQYIMNQEGYTPEVLPFDSYSPLLPGSRGCQIGGLQKMKDGHYYGCCACIGAAGIGVAHKAATLLSRSGLVMNFYIPGTIRTKTPSGASLRLKTTTLYPADGQIRIAVLPEQEERFSLALRIPSWSAETMLSINGDEEAVQPGYHVITRCWKAGDTLLLRLDMRTRVIRPIPYGSDTVLTDMNWKEDRLYPQEITESENNQKHIAFQRGPLVLAVDARTGVNPDQEIDVDAKDEMLSVKGLPAKSVPFDAILAVAVPLKDGKTLMMVDYASAGKTLHEDSRMAAWLNTK